MKRIDTKNKVFDAKIINPNLTQEEHNEFSNFLDNINAIYEMNGKKYHNYKYGSYKLNSTYTQDDFIDRGCAMTMYKNGKTYIPKEYNKQEWLSIFCDKVSDDIWIYSEEKNKNHKTEWILEKQYNKNKNNCCICS